MTTPTVVQVKSARHAFGNRHVLNGADLELRAGEIYCLLGVNGAGKTTLMRAICGRLKLDKGKVTCGGRDVYLYPSAREQIAFVPQNIALYPYLTVAENLAVFGRLAGVRGTSLHSAITAVMASSGLTERAKQLTNTLSGGYQRRVNICASILHKPPALVLDEPTVGIDVDARDAIHVILADLKTRGTALLLTTHDLEQAEAIADRVGILHQGRIVIEGTPATLINSILGDSKEVTAVFARPPEEGQLPVLAEFGFGVTQKPTYWRAQISPEVLAADWPGNKLAAAGLSVKEIIVRDPDLGSVFRAVIDSKAAPA